MRKIIWDKVLPLPDPISCLQVAAAWLAASKQPQACDGPPTFSPCRDPHIPGFGHTLS